MKTLIVIDMQNDFIDGSLGTPEAQAIVEKVKAKIEEYRANGDEIIFTRDGHDSRYLTQQEGRKLPIEHCMYGSHGREISSELSVLDSEVIDKATFGATWSLHNINGKEIELVGLCTDICVVSNALLLKKDYPEREITVDASCCAGTTVERHKAALETMKSCQINVIGE